MTQSLKNRKKYTVIEYDIDGKNIIFSDTFNSMFEIAEHYNFSHDKIKRIKDGYYIGDKKKIHRKTQNLLKISIFN
jgi:hypothetical protein